MLFDTCTYNYDSVNQLIAHKNEGVSSQNINFEYNSLGQLIQQTLASSRTDITTHYQWDSFGNPQSQTVKSNTSDADTRDTASSSIELTHATHGEHNELAPNSSESSSNADPVINNDGTNNTTINSATDADRLTQYGDSDFYYDEFGNQIRETGKGIKTRREYNAFNQLSCFNNNGTLTQYDYDPLGRRIAKHTEHGKIDYIWDNDQLIGEYQHGEYNWYINLPNQFHPVALIKQGEVYYYHLDQLNTPRFVTNNKAEVVWENQADAYGYEESEVSTTNSFTQPIRFQGQYLDEESGLHYNRYRYYSPKQQRFINQDPIGLVGGINHYQYAANPVNWVDPFGLQCKEGQAKVKAALDANSAIPLELKEKIIALTKLKDSGYTADEMIGHINNNTVDEMLKSVVISPSVLNKENLLGKGAFKEAYIIDNDTVFLTPIKQVHHNKPHSMDDLRQEAFLLDYLEKQHNIPVLKIYGEKSLKHADGCDVKGLVAERKLFNGKDVQSIRKGNNTQGLTMDDVRNSITPDTLKELERVDAIIEKDKVVIKDLQIMYGKDGWPVIADPLDAYAGKYADEKDVLKSKVPLRQNVEMVKFILNSKT